MRISNRKTAQPINQTKMIWIPVHGLSQNGKKIFKVENNKFAETISKEEISKLPLKQFEGKIYIVENHTGLKKAVKYLKKQPVLGFDTETKPAFRKNRKNKVSLLQLSTNQKAYLFRLNKTGLYDGLVDILSNEEIIKVGAALKDDLKSLKEWADFEPNGFIDLQQYSTHFGIIANALKSLTAIVLGFRISKGQQTSNWENETLTEQQIIYAATDA